MVNGLFRLKGPALRYHVRNVVAWVCGYVPCARVGFSPTIGNIVWHKWLEPQVAAREINGNGTIHAYTT